MNAQPEPLDEERTPAVGGDPLISFDGVSYSYTEGSPALKNITLEINEGERIGVIGGTGSGKSTLVDLLMRMCDENRVKGVIRYRGRDITGYSLSEHRRRFSRVLQEPFLFSGTIAENIGIARDGMTPDEISSAARLSALSLPADKFPDGMETFVGERGVTLSGGQKQRCAIAAALAKDSEVLILDDAFSALDAQTEAVVRKNVFEAFAGKTMIIISHRINTIAGCDRIYVLDGGEITEQGTHSELISRKGLYRDIYELQAGQ